MRRAALLPLLLVLTALACNTFFPPRPEVAWDPDPAVVVIELATLGGLLPPTYMDSYIPAARVWGDGRIIWTTFDAPGGRRVLAGQLTAAELQALLQRFVDAGFFGWQAFYQPPYQVYDGGTTILTVQLLTESRKVAEYMDGAPAQFDGLVQVLAEGAGAAGGDFVPERGYLRAYRQTGNSAPPEAVWPDERLGFTLAEAETAGRYIEGAALQFAWAALNRSQFGLIASGGQAFQITLQVPGVTYQEPPAP